MNLNRVLAEEEIHAEWGVAYRIMVIAEKGGLRKSMIARLSAVGSSALENGTIVETTRTDRDPNVTVADLMDRMRQEVARRRPEQGDS